MGGGDECMWVKLRSRMSAAWRIEFTPTWSVEESTVSDLSLSVSEPAASIRLLTADSRGYSRCYKFSRWRLSKVKGLWLTFEFRRFGVSSQGCWCSFVDFSGVFVGSGPYLGVQ